MINVSRFLRGAAMSAWGPRSPGCGGAPPSLPGPGSRIASDVEYLASPSLGGRSAGSPGSVDVARRLAATPPPRSVLFVHFDAEEMGLIGSHGFVKEPPIPLDSVVVMINLDMVGRLRKDELTVDVPPNGEGFLGLVDSLATAGRLRLLITGEFAARSDHGPFDAAMVPAFALFTGLHADYHTAMDLPVRVNINRVLRVADLVEQLARPARPRL